MHIRKKPVAKSVQVILEKAEECLDAAKKQHNNADQLETIGDALIVEAVELNGESLVTSKD
jgi:hypothetical protein